MSECDPKRVSADEALAVALAEVARLREENVCLEADNDRLRVFSTMALDQRDRFAAALRWFRDNAVSFTDDEAFIAWGADGEKTEDLPPEVEAAIEEVGE